MAEFNKKQSEDMNNFKSVSDKDFDEMIVNKDVIMFNKSSQDKLNNDYTGESPYGQYDESGTKFISAPTVTKNNPILTKKGAEIIHNDIREIYDNQKRMYSSKAMKMNDGQLDQLNHDIDLQDKDLNSDLRYDLNDKDNMDKSVQYSDGADIDHPEIYQRSQSDGIEISQRGSLDEEAYEDGPSFSDGYPSDKKMEINSIKSHPRGINYLITNTTRPIFNNEGSIRDSQTSVPYLAGREETNNSVGISVVCANTSENRKHLNQILKDNAPRFQKAYQKDIASYAKKMSMQPDSFVNRKHKQDMNKKMGKMMKRTWKQRTQNRHQNVQHVAKKSMTKSNRLSKKQKMAFKNKGIQRN